MLKIVTVFLPMMLIPVAAGFVAGIIFRWIARLDKKAFEEKTTAANTEKAVTINSAVEFVQGSISELRETTERIKKQTEEINVMTQRLCEFL